MKINKGTVEGFNVKRDERGPYIDLKLRGRPTTGELAELYGLLLHEDLTLEVEIRARQGTLD